MTFGRIVYVTRDEILRIFSTKGNEINETAEWMNCDSEDSEVEIETSKPINFFICITWPEKSEDMLNVSRCKYKNIFSFHKILRIFLSYISIYREYTNLWKLKPIIQVRPLKS